MRVIGYDPFISEAAAREFSVELVPLEGCTPKATSSRCTPQ